MNTAVMKESESYPKQFPKSSLEFDEASGVHYEVITKQEVNIRDYIRETRPWYQVPHLRMLSFSIFLVTLVSTTSGFDGSLLNGLQSLDDWTSFFGHPTGHKLGAITSGYTLGNILSIPIAPYLSDKFGRVKTTLFGSCWVIVGAILQGAASGATSDGAYAMFLIARLIMGFGAALGALAGPSLISEIAYPTHREASTFAYNLCWYLGAVVVAIITYFTKNITSKNLSWRIPCFLQAFFPTLQISLCYFIPESPRYLIAKGRDDEAEKILKRIHIGNSNHPKDIEFINFEISEIKAGLEAERIAGITSKYSDFFLKKSYRKRLFLVLWTAIYTQLSGNGLVSYYLSKVLTSIGYTGTNEQLKINLCLNIYNLFLCLIICGVCGMFKRRTLFTFGMVGMLICYIIWTALSAVNQKKDFVQKSLGQGVLSMIFLYYFFYNIGANGLPYIYITEILPYSHRAKGMNIFSGGQQIILVYNAYVNPIAMDAIDWKYYIVYCCLLAVECLVVFLFYPETSGRTLEEVAEVFDGVSDHDVIISDTKMIESENTEHKSYEVNSLHEKPGV